MVTVEIYIPALARVSLVPSYITVAYTILETHNAYITGKKVGGLYFRPRVLFCRVDVIVRLFHGLLTDKNGLPSPLLPISIFIYPSVLVVKQYLSFAFPSDLLNTDQPDACAEYLDVASVS